MYFNHKGVSKIVKKEVVEEYLNKKRKGNVIYCLRFNDNYFAKDERYKTLDELNLQVSKYILEGYEVYYNADDTTDKARSPKGKR